MLNRKNPKESKDETGEKVLEVNASMTGTLTFKDPVNLQINGNFEGTLDTKGSLEIGEKASVKAGISGDIVVISGDVVGNVRASKELQINAPGRLVGDVETPSLSIQKGAVLQGKVNMIGVSTTPRMSRIIMNAEELASYLAVEKSLIFEWADNGKLPGIKEGSSWKFEKSKVDEWVANGRIK